VADPTPNDAPSYVSRGALKLAAALESFSIDATEWRCVDLGCSTGGFTDCLLQAGARRVFAVDTAYGELAWKLRQDPRVVVMERTNALHAQLPAEVASAGGLELAVIDLGWTPQRLAVPAALRWVPPGGLIVTLIKPHYEAADATRGGKGAVLEEEEAERVSWECARSMEAMGCELIDVIESPIRGGKRGKSGKGRGNREWLAALRATHAD